MEHFKISILKSTSPQNLKYICKKGIIKNQDNIQILVLYDGHNIKGKNNNLNSFSFSKSDFNLSNLELTLQHTKTQENTSLIY